MGCLDGASFTGRTGRYGQSLEIEGDEQDGAVPPIDAEVDDVGQDVIASAIEVEPGVALDEPVIDGISQAPRRKDAVVPFGFQELRSLAETGNGCNVLRPRPQAVFLRAAVSFSCHVQAVADVQGADAFGAVNLMAAYGQHVDALF